MVDLGTVLPMAKGLQLLGIPETKLALQGIVGVDPNMFFSAVQSAAPALLHLRSQPDTAPYQAGRMGRARTLDMR